MKNFKKIFLISLLSILLALSFTACGGDRDVPVESVTIAGEAAVDITVGGSKTFAATVNPDNATNKSVTWSIKEGATATGATVTQSGAFSAGSVAGTAVVRAESQADAAKFAEVTVTVKATTPGGEDEPEVTEVTLTGSKERVIAIGASTSFVYTSVPADAAASNFTWSVLETDLNAGTDFTFSDGVLTSVSANSGYVKIKIALTGSTTVVDTATVNINYSAITYHAVTFYAEDGITVLDVQSVANGSAAVAPNYVVVGQEVTWDEDFSNVTEEIDVTASLTSIEYTISFYTFDDESESYVIIDVDGEGTLQSVAFGDSAVMPETVQYEREGYQFLNWRIQKTGNVFKLYAEYVLIPVPEPAE